MGRKLHHAFKKAGFEDLEISIYAKADVDGRLLGMIRNMAKYARDSDTMDLAKIDHVVDQARMDGTYLAVSPQFVVTGRKAV